MSVLILGFFCSILVAHRDNKKQLKEEESIINTQLQPVSHQFTAYLQIYVYVSILGKSSNNHVIDVAA